MGIRKSRQTERLGVGGWGAIRSSHQYDPYVVTFHCTSVYVCGPITANIGRVRGDRKMKAPLARGFNSGRMRGWEAWRAGCH